MTEPQQPKFQWGQPVAASIDLFNDGTFPGEPEGALLAKAGDKGEIVQIGIIRKPARMSTWSSSRRNGLSAASKARSIQFEE
jgi:hypothetical protein